MIFLQKNQRPVPPIYRTAPVGEIHDSVLWYFAQCLIYAGSAVGIDLIIDERIRKMNK